MVSSLEPHKSLLVVLDSRRFQSRTDCAFLSPRKNRFVQNRLQSWVLVEKWGCLTNFGSCSFPIRKVILGNCWKLKFVCPTRMYKSEDGIPKLPRRGDLSPKTVWIKQFSHSWLVCYRLYDTVEHFGSDCAPPSRFHGWCPTVSPGSPSWCLGLPLQRLVLPFGGVVERRRFLRIRR